MMGNQTQKGKGLLPRSDPRRGEGRDNTKIYFCPYNFSIFFT